MLQNDVLCFTVFIFLCFFLSCSDVYFVDGVLFVCDLVAGVSGLCTFLHPLLRFLAYGLLDDSSRLLSGVCLM
jgi:hypothetical protein